MELNYAVTCFIIIYVLYTYLVEESGAYCALRVLCVTHNENLLKYILAERAQTVTSTIGYDLEFTTLQLNIYIVFIQYGLLLFM